MNPFVDWLPEVESDPVIVDATGAGITAEAHGNCWAFSLTQQQAQAVTPDEVMGFVRAVAAARARQVAERSGRSHPMVFYCWHDAQDGQLRFSLVSASHGRLPFQGEVTMAEDLSSVVGEFLGSAYHDGIPLEEFVPVEFGQEAFDTDDAGERYRVSVWALRIPVPEAELPVA